MIATSFIADSPTSELERKQREFNRAMEVYETKPVYSWIGRLVSVLCIGLQAYLMVLAWQQPLPILWHGLAAILAFVLADFFNGLVHLIMDHNDHYTSFVGPFIANFHLHHKTPVYKQNPLWLVYFNETGAKVWLVFFLVIATVAFNIWLVPPSVIALVAYFAIFSSVAEVSHYLCHVPHSNFLTFLGNVGILLGKKHHSKHHRFDNQDYAFLNGMTDPVLNLIARRFFPGYKQRTDLHFGTYQGKGSTNRSTSLPSPS
jgi:hypothetical protein